MAPSTTANTRLKACVKVSVTPATHPAHRDDKIEIRRAVEILRRRNALIKAGIFPFPQGYADDLMADSYTRLPD